jgi:exodeoxyribonuclease V alpha subunit
MERYLGSGLIKGVGPKYAARIVQRFGLETLEVLDQEPERLSEVEGLGRKLVKKIKVAWQEQKEVHEIMVFLQGHNISATYAVKIYKTYGRAALQVVRENPYRLTEDIWGIGFRIADRIAISVGLPTHDPSRARAGLLFVLTEASGNGHCYLPEEELLRESSQLLEVPVELVAGQLPVLINEEKLVLSGERIYLAALFYAEQGTATALLRIADGPVPWGELRPEEELEAISDEMPVTLAPEQSEALQLALENRLAVITGGPGTGKSTILKAMILMLETKGVRISLAAPTGRAAKRLSEATGREARTIHRLLEFTPAVGGFSRNAENPLETDLVVIDEVSMLDIILANALLRAIPTGCAVLLVGDGDQLPSVGPGNFLKDITASNMVKVAQLTRIFRQGEGSLISINAARINQGQSFDLLPDYKGDKDFYYISRETPEEIEKEIVSLCQGRLSSKYGFDSCLDIQVLAPMRKGLVGIENLNRRLQQVINKRAGEQVSGATEKLTVGDKVMQLRNNYDKEVFNGDLGLVLTADEEDQVWTIEMDGRPVRYEAAEISELQLAYAITVHKSQGSEFPCIILPVHSIHYPLLQRNLLYTAITRGRQLVVVVGSRKAIGMAISNDRVQQRNSGLRERMAEGSC